VTASYKTHLKNKTRPDFSECLKLLQSVALLFPKVFIVIDALDECRESDGIKQSIVDAVLSIRSQDVYVMITSRKTDEIENMCKAWPRVEIRAEDQLQDIRKYINGHIHGGLLGVVEDPDYPEMREKVISAILESSKGV
jgi:hypothetical protein